MNGDLGDLVDMDGPSCVPAEAPCVVQNSGSDLSNLLSTMNLIDRTGRKGHRQV